MSFDFSELNQEQAQAVKTVNGPVIVFAGAGTGKTKTLTHRIAYMIKEKSIPAKNILAITFTKKATNEMKERILSYVGPEAGKVFISTIHSLCAQILRHNAHLLGYKNSFEIMDEEDMLKVLTEVCKDNNIDRKMFSPKAALHMISAFKNGVSELIGIVKKIYNDYQNYTFNNNLVDFDDLLLLTLQLFEENPKILEFYQDKFQYILVDEFQDTNLVQYEIIKLLAMKHHNVFVVGDDDQSIYSFRGARSENMNKFLTEFPDVQLIKLEKNYRSSNALLKGANTMIANNINRQAKELYSDRDGQNRDVNLYEAPYFEDEIRYVVNEINHLVNNGLRHRDIAILYRNSVISRNFELAFIECGIPYKIYGGFSYLKRREIKDVISYLRFIVDENNFLHFKRIINQPSRGIGEKTITKIKSYMDENQISLFEAIDRVYEKNPSSKNETLRDFKKLILSLQEKINQMDLISFFDLMMEKTGYLDMIRDEDNQEINRLGNLEEFKSILFKMEQNFDEDVPNKDILKYSFDELLLDETLGDESRSNKGVVLSTIHSIKGLEFKAVFVVALEEGIFPAIKEDVDIEEERRVAYVAFTRPKEKIYLTCSNKRLIYGRMVKNMKSRFLTEYLDCQELLNEESLSEVPEKVPGDIRVHDRIFHTNYGYGLVIAVAEPNIQVIFEKDHSLRKILKNHPSVTKC